MAPPGMEQMTDQLQGMFQNLGGQRKVTRKVRVREATRLLTDEEAAALINDDELKHEALQRVEQDGIVFLDEIDKIVGHSERHGADVSREGVQRDLLPLIEGSTVSTRSGMVKTDHILFIASGERIRLSTTVFRVTRLRSCDMSVWLRTLGSTKTRLSRA